MFISTLEEFDKGLVIVESEGEGPLGPSLTRSNFPEKGKVQKIWKSYNYTKYLLYMIAKYLEKFLKCICLCNGNKTFNDKNEPQY